MGPLRKLRILFWPAAASAAVIGLLFVFQKDNGDKAGVATNRGGSTYGLPKPWTLSDDEPERTKMAWTGPSLSGDQFSRGDLVYPYAPPCEVSVTVEPSTPVLKPEFQIEPINLVVSEPVIAEPEIQTEAFVAVEPEPITEPDPAIVVESVVAAEVAPEPTIDSEPMILSDVEPLVDAQVETPPAITLMPPTSSEEEDTLAGLPVPKSDPFAGMQLTGTRESPVVEASIEPTPEPTIPRIPVERPIDRAEIVQPPSVWPATVRLDRQLSAIAATSAKGSLWADKVSVKLAELNAEPRLGSSNSGVIIERLQELSQEAYDAAGNDDSLDTRRQWNSIAYAIQRRTEVWNAVWNSMRELDTQLTSKNEASSLADIAALVAAVREELKGTDDIAGWSNFLLLGDFDQVIDRNDDEEARQLLAQRYLSRIEYTELSEAQRKWLEESSCQQLGSAVRTWAHGPVDYVALLDQLETQESDTLDRGAGRVAATMQTLRFAGTPDAYNIAAVINKHYRNANIRLSISEEMLRRLLPEVPEKTQRIEDNIIGASVLGTSFARTDLNVNLKPATDAWQIYLSSLGTISSTTISTQGPAKLNHQGSANFQAGATIRVDRQGVQVGFPEVDVNAQNTLRRLRTNYDGFPVIGPLVREFVLQRHNETRGIAKRYSENKMSNEIGSQLSESLRTQVSEAEDVFSRRLLGPLATLDLTPTVVDMSTSEERLTVRYRLAGDWQLAAFTPRPQAPTKSLMSLQIHQSTLNNSLERLAPKGAPMSIVAAIENTMRVFGFAPTDPTNTTDDLPRNVNIQFTSTRPMTVEIEDGRLELTLRIVRLMKEDGIQLRNFIVKATYLPQIDGLKPMLAREGHLSISGPRMGMGDRVAIRTIFNKVLSPTRPLEITSEKLTLHPATKGLAITQFELRDGWIGFAVGDEKNFMANRSLYSAPTTITR